MDNFSVNIQKFDKIMLNIVKIHFKNWIVAYSNSD